MTYAVHVNEEEETSATMRNAFDILMSLQRALQSAGKDIPNYVPE